MIFLSKSWNKTLKWFKSIYWLFKYYGWRYENTDDYNPSRKRKILIAFDNMIAEIMINEKFQAIMKELFIRCRKLNISLVFITQSDFSVSEDVRLIQHITWSWRLTTKENYKMLQLIILQISIIKILWRFTENAYKNYILFVIDTALPASDPLRFRKQLFHSYKKDSS